MTLVLQLLRAARKAGLMVKAKKGRGRAKNSSGERTVRDSDTDPRGHI